MLVKDTCYKVSLDAPHYKNRLMVFEFMGGPERDVAVGHDPEKSSGRMSTMICVDPKHLIEIH